MIDNPWQTEILILINVAVVALQFMPSNLAQAAKVPHSFQNNHQSFHTLVFQAIAKCKAVYVSQETFHSLLVDICVADFHCGYSVSTTNCI